MIVGDLAQVLFSIPDEAAEAVANLLTERVGGGIEQRDGDTMTRPSTEGVTELIAWMPASDVSSHVERVEQLLKSLGEMGTRTDPWSWRSEDADPEAWVEAYKRFFKVERLGRRTVIKPSWEKFEPAANDLVVEIDPGQAFGTGLHASTRLVITALERAARIGPTPSSVLDVGCGTGILSIVAARLWPGCDVVAIDNDPIAVKVAQENVARNGLSERIDVVERAGDAITGRFSLICANLTFDALKVLQPVFRRSLDDLGRLIMSGLLSEQAAEIQRLYTRDLALESAYTEEQSGWRSVVVRVRV